jgi:ubiquinone biosynthesis monooxygenase Coq7
MESRRYSRLDRLLGQINRTINALAAPITPSVPSPGNQASEAEMSPAERRVSARLMRVNHSGEVAAQALYEGQAFTARSPQVAETMRQAAAEEKDHLAWCEQRLRELGGRSSVLNAAWYAGSFAIGAVAGLIGDSSSLGFIVETERQVEAHLHDHLRRLPVADVRSRLILEHMKVDEAGHAAKARALGAEPLPWLVQSAMQLTSQLMTRGSYWV